MMLCMESLPLRERDFEMEFYERFLEKYHEYDNEIIMPVDVNDNEELLELIALSDPNNRGNVDMETICFSNAAAFYVANGTLSIKDSRVVYVNVQKIRDIDVKKGIVKSLKKTNR